MIDEIQIGKKVNPIQAPKTSINIDTSSSFTETVLSAAETSSLDISSINALTQSAQNREQSYTLIDSMTQDSLIAAALETYAEESIQPNEKGQIIWVESNDTKAFNYLSWLLDSLNIENQIFKWAYCLVTYGDVYLRLYRQSDQAAAQFSNKQLTNLDNKVKLDEDIKSKIAPELLTEDIKLRVYDANDRYIPYVEMVANPGEMFDLQRFGKTQGYIKAPTRVLQQTTDALYNYLTRYKINRQDIELFDASAFVHGCLESTSQRQPELVELYLDQTQLNASTADAQDSMSIAYSVKRGQSILYNSFRTWRQLNLLELSAMLNRLTKSAVVRILNIDIGDMPKEQVQGYVQRLKERIEQKSALSVDVGMAEYTNPGPIENTIYIPTHGTQGTITAQTIGGDFDPKSLVDVEYFRDRLLGSLKIPKQFLGFTDDAAGFNGGTSLTIYSSRFGKSIKSLQHILCQVVTDLLNLFLLDRGLDIYVNKFTVRMQEPVTQEELDRRSNIESRVSYINNVMSLFGDVDDKVTKLNLLKALVSDNINNTDVAILLAEYIDKVKAAEAQSANAESAESVDTSDTLQEDIQPMFEAEKPESASSDKLNLPKGSELAQDLLN